MAGTIGVGSALRRAREIREITLDEAVRDTKLRTDQLRALEDEDFEAARGGLDFQVMPSDRLDGFVEGGDGKAEHVDGGIWAIEADAELAEGEMLKLLQEDELG